MNFKDEQAEIKKLYPVVVSVMGNVNMIEVCDDFDLYFEPMGFNEQEILNDIFNRLAEFNPRKMTHKIVVNN